MGLTEELLNVLKAQFLAVAGPRPFETEDGSSLRRFYLQTLPDNLISPMPDRVRAAYSSGSGRELREKMRALRSSSAMTFNLLGGGDATIRPDGPLGAGEYKVAYEKQLRTLRREEGGLPANLDALLTNRETGECVACEMKLLEWTAQRQPAGLRSAYLDIGNYDDPSVGAVFVRCAERLSLRCTPAGAESAPQLCRYDGFQMFKHALACCHACREGTLSAGKLTLLNCVWELPDRSLLPAASRDAYVRVLEEEHRGFAFFQETMEPVRSLFSALGVSFSILYLPVNAFVDLLVLPPARRNALRRYTFAPSVDVPEGGAAC